MGKALLKGTFLGGIIVFIWLMISWMVIPWHCTSLQKFTDENAVAQVIMANAEKDGVYVLPNRCDSKGGNQAEMQGMPGILMTLQKEGYSMSNPRPYIVGIAIQLIGALIITYLLLQTKNLSYGGRVLFVTMCGLLVAVLGSLPNMNWWGFSSNFTLVQMLDYVIGWFLAGLAIAKVVRP